MNKSLMMAATLGAGLVAAVVFAAPQAASAKTVAASPMDRAAAFALATEN
jgi:hypothetical protein